MPYLTKSRLIREIWTEKDLRFFNSAERYHANWKFTLEDLGIFVLWGIPDFHFQIQFLFFPQSYGGESSMCYFCTGNCRELVKCEIVVNVNEGKSFGF